MPHESGLSERSTQTKSIILVKTDYGDVPIKFGKDDVIPDLNQYLQPNCDYAIDQQQIIRMSRDTVEIKENGRLVQTFAAPSKALWVKVTEMTKSVTTELPGSPVAEREGSSRADEGNNMIGNLEASDSTSVFVGDYHSEMAISHWRQTVGVALNIVSKASVKGNAKVRVGNKFGGRDPDE